MEGHKNLLGMMLCSLFYLWQWFHIGNTRMSKLTELYTLNVYNLLRVNFISIKLFKKYSGGSYNKQNSEGKGHGVDKSRPNGTSRKAGGVGRWESEKPEAPPGLVCFGWKLRSALSAPQCSWGQVKWSP